MVTQKRINLHVHAFGAGISSSLIIARSLVYMPADDVKAKPVNTIPIPVAGGEILEVEW